MSSGSWEQLADAGGGTVAGLAVAGGEGRSVVFAATPVGVFRSLDAGQVWELPGAGGTVPFAEAVAVSPAFARDRTVYACGSDGLYRSTDAGQAWQRLLVGSRVLGLAASIGENRDVCVLAATETDGVLRSDDRGSTWTGANAGLLDLTAMCLGLSPGFHADRTGFVGTASGLYRTRNGARSWRVVETGLDEPAVQCLAVSPDFANDRLVLAGTETDGLLRSQDGGATWTVPAALSARSVTALAFSADYPSRPTIAAATDAGVAVSRDAGLTWQTTGAGPGGVLSLTFLADAAGGDVLLAGLQHAGVARSRDAGAAWEPLNAGLSARLLTVLAVSPALNQDQDQAQTLFVAGPDRGVGVSEDGGRTWAERNEGLQEPAVLGLVVSDAYARDQTLYAISPTGIHLSRDRARTWHPLASAPAPATALAIVPPDPAPAGSAAAAGAVTLVAAAGGGRVFASDDGGERWRAWPAAFGGAEVRSLALSPDFARDRTAFAMTSRLGSDWSGETVLWRSVDAGERWVRWLVERATGSDGVVAVAVSPDYPADELVFVGIGGRVLKPLRHARQVTAGERRPVWRAAELGQDVTVTGLAISPAFAHDRTLFAATSAGVFVSRDAGETYLAWNEGLQPPRTVAIAVSPAYAADRTIYALGLGGAVWRRRAAS